ncbi:helix-turn-helix transcriptional regulator [Mesorhizobium sp. CO1-1-8]|uniref:helix-turn-helix transcriptional regulator n=1 Tax=Mesorhizobium sp. CO1-1-8 TaxID=2876631 RepID=UPI001CD1743C|nr:helix-turn-helix transcriptional regulator [Mesorhizobium sp. CO1-1-8]MBZ9775008.1 helix-turn-helix transcriptional regulator [Mesorhizobium sp. CO1-1-8]
MGAAFDFDAIGIAFTEAAVDPTRWDAAMEAVSELTGSVGAVLFDTKGHLPGIPHSASMSPSFEAYVRDGWIHHDERYRIVPLIERRGVATDLDLLTVDEMNKHPYYREFLEPFDLKWFAGVKAAAGGDLWCLSIQRSKAQGTFSPDELRQLADFSTRLGSMVAVARALGFARVEAALEAFDISGTAAVMLDRDGQVLRTNGPADQLLGHDLQITHRQLVSYDKNATDALRRRLRGMLLLAPPLASTTPVLLPRVGKRPLIAYLLRLATVSYSPLAPCQAIIVLVDQDSRGTPSIDVLQHCFGLTFAEAKLAGRICSGIQIDVAADQLGISYETARTQLKAIFTKTETHRQAELVALLGGLAIGGR